jgi:hypothetical protein
MGKSMKESSWIALIMMPGSYNNIPLYHNYVYTGRIAKYAQLLSEKVEPLQSKSSRKMELRYQ